MANNLVLLFVPSLRGGGAERAIVNIARALVLKGYRVKIALCRLEGDYIKEAPDNVELINLSSGRVAFGVIKLLRVIWKLRPMTVISTLTHANVATALLKPFFPKATQLILRESSTPSLTRKENKSIYVQIICSMISWSYKKADKIAAVSSGVKEDLVSCFGLQDGNIFVAPSSVITDDIAPLSDHIPELWPFRPNEEVVLAVGRLVKAKNFEMLISAFSKVKRQRSCKLIILGEGPDREHLQSLVDTKGLSEDVLMPGFVKNPYSYMRRCSLFVLSSNREGFPNVLVQAVYCGATVISTDCKSGPGEVLTGDNREYLVPVDDSVAMAKKILDVLDKRPDQKINVDAYHYFRSINIYIEHFPH